MFLPQQGSTRAAFLIEHVEPNGEKKILIYHISAPITIDIEREYPSFYNVFDGFSSRPIPAKIRIEAYLSDMNPREWDGPMPAQEEIAPAQLAIESNEGEIVVDEEGFEEWQNET